MNSRQYLLPLYRALRPLVDRLHLNRPAHRVWAILWKARAGGLIRTTQNGRRWRLDPDVALRGADQEMETIRWFRSVIVPGMTVIDVGANVGQMTLEMAELVGPSGRVVAVEPGPGNLALLRRHVEENGFGARVTIVAAACGAQHGGDCELAIEGERPDEVGSGFQVAGLGLRPNAGAKQGITIRVSCVSIDGLCSDLNLRPAVLKIDVEGAEVDVFRGAARALSELRPDIRFGFHPFAFADPGAAQQSILDMLRRSGLNPPDAGTQAWGLTELNVGGGSRLRQPPSG